MNGEAFYHALLRSAAAGFPACPAGRFRGRGIVLCAGGLRHLTNAFVCMKLLREFTGLPIELFHAGAAEMPPPVADLLRRDFAPIALVDITAPASREVCPFLRVDHFRGFQIKPFALLHSSFAEIFYIDADNIPLQSPEPLFAWEEYLRTGALFWPDLERTKSTSESLFRVFGVTATALRRGDEFESGQMVLDKRRCWKALLTTCLANSDAAGFRDFCFRHTLGDKDTFRLAFAFAGQPYHLLPHPALRVGNRFVLVPVPLTGLEIKIQHDLGSFYATGILQHDRAGDPLFAHKTVCEWNAYLDFRTLTSSEDREGEIRPRPFLAEREELGYRYLREFRERYLPAFGRDGFQALQGLLARGIVKVLDGVAHLQGGALSAKKPSGDNQ